MKISVLVCQALLYGHIIAFALALATILKEDVRLLRAKRIDSASLLASAKLVKWLLLALWVTGVPMVMMDIGTDVSLLLGKPKLLAKLIVVGALTLNGILMHLFAFPMVPQESEESGHHRSNPGCGEHHELALCVLCRGRPTLTVALVC
jgi:hypothetical protein